MNDNVYSALNQPNPEEQSDWAAIVCQSRFDTAGIARRYNINAGTLSLYIRLLVKPREKTKQKVIEIMKDLINKPKAPFHPSYGYATPEEIEKIKSMGVGPDRDYLLKKIAQRSAKGGKEK